MTRYPSPVRVVPWFSCRVLTDVAGGGRLTRLWLYALHPSAATPSGAIPKPGHDESALFGASRNLPLSETRDEQPDFEHLAIVSDVIEPQKKHGLHSIKGNKDENDTAATEQLQPSNTASSQFPEPLDEENKPIERWYHSFKEPVEDVPEAARVIISIPGDLWLRSLKAIVLPLILCSMLLAVQRLRVMSNGGSLLAKWTVGFYVITTCFSITMSCIMISLVWEPIVPDTEDLPIHTVVLQMFQSLIPKNVVNSLTTDGLLAIIIMAIIWKMTGINDPPDIEEQQARDQEFEEKGKTVDLGDKV
ncbi:Fc.00g040420.m01.CDS01 [Cosmosporella sp. VM-42]